MPVINIDNVRINVSEKHLNYILKSSKEVTFEPCSCEKHQDLAKVGDFVLTQRELPKGKTEFGFISQISGIRFAQKIIQIRTQAGPIVFDPKSHSILCERCYGKKLLV